MLQIIKIIPALKRLNTSDLFLKLTIIALIVIIVLIIKIIHIFHLLILKYEGKLATDANKTAAKKLTLILLDFIIKSYLWKLQTYYLERTGNSQ